MDANSLLNAILKSYRGGVGYLRDRELGRRRTVKNLEELSARLEPKDFVEIMLPQINGGDLAALKLDTLEYYIDSIAEVFEDLGDKDRKMCVERIIVPVIAKDTSTRQKMGEKHRHLHKKALDLLDKVNPEMLNPHVGVLVAMLENRYEYVDPRGRNERPALGLGGRSYYHDDDEFGKVLSLLQKVERKQLKNQVGGLLKAMGVDVMSEWRQEVAELLEEIPNVNWDLYVEEICEMLMGESEDLGEYTYFVNYISPEIRPRVVWENDEDYMIERRHTVDNMMDYFDDPTGDAAFDGENLANDSMDMEGVWELLS